MAAGAPFTVAGLGKLIERAGVAAKIGFKVHMHAAKTIPPAVVASAVRSSAGADKHGVCSTPTLPPRWTGRGRLADSRTARGSRPLRYLP